MAQLPDQGPTLPSQWPQCAQAAGPKTHTEGRGNTNQTASLVQGTVPAQRARQQFPLGKGCDADGADDAAADDAAAAAAVAAVAAVTAHDVGTKFLPLRFEWGNSFFL